jgi:hypothetical protein
MELRVVQLVTKPLYQLRNGVQTDFAVLPVCYWAGTKVRFTGILFISITEILSEKNSTWQYYSFR